MADPPQKYNVIFVLGGPGSGKGTQCTKIAQKYDYVHLSAGDLLRKELQKENSVHRSLIETSMKEGKIIPEEITCKLLRQAMDESGKSDFLIDGFPRNENNRKGWEKMMKDIAHIKMVLLFCCSKETCFKRCLSRGKERIDDVTEILEKRYETFNDLTLKTIVEYRKQNLLEEINAEGDMDEVFEAVKKVFEK